MKWTPDQTDRDHAPSPESSDSIPITGELGEPSNGLSQAFDNLTRELRKKYEINRGVLVVRRHDNQRLAAVSTWNEGSIRDGLAISLPREPSLFEKVAETGEVYTENFCDAFSGNFFERKLLLDDDSRSFVVQPLKVDSEVCGVLAYSSVKPTAFTMFEEGAAERTARSFASTIRTLLSKTEIT